MSLEAVIKAGLLAGNTTWSILLWNSSFHVLPRASCPRIARGWSSIQPGGDGFPELRPGKINFALPYGRPDTHTVSWTLDLWSKIRVLSQPLGLRVMAS